MSIRENLSLASLRSISTLGFLSRPREERQAAALIQQLNIVARSSEQLVATLSGGNQQKGLIRRALAIEPRILLLDEPTRGVDIGAKQEIYALIERLVEEGMAVMLISSDMEEILRLSDRVVVLRRGQIAATLSRPEASETAIMRAAALAA